MKLALMCLVCCLTIPLQLLANGFSSNFLPSIPLPAPPKIAGTLSSIKDLRQLKSLAPDSGDTVDIKFLIKDYPDNPKIYFMSAIKYPWHYQLASTIDKVDYDKSQFSQSCSDHSTGFVCGFIKYIPAVDPSERDYNKERYLWYLYHDDSALVSDIKGIHKAIQARLPNEYLFNLIGGGGDFVYHSSWMPQGEEQHEWASSAELKETEPVFPHQLLKKGEEKILNPGFAVGNLRVIANPDELQSLTYTDFVILDMNHIPLDLPPVAGVVSRVDQHTLSHINLLSKNRGTPNVYIDGVLDRPDFRSLIGKKVKFRARQNRVQILSATDVEMENFWSQKRPKTITSLEAQAAKAQPFNLKESTLPAEKLVKISGSKATNLTSLSRIPDFPVPSFLLSIPFFWYQDHMQNSGIEVEFKDRLNSSEMQVNFQFRQATLKALRSAIKDAPIDPSLLEALQIHVRESYGLDRPIRFRSSSNAEDLPFFNGAGLYDSKTGFFETPAGLEKKTVARAIKKVWASLWNLQAYQEREFYKIDHSTAKMAILVQPSYPSEREKANGVALVHEGSQGGIALEVNIAQGDRSITNPEPGDTRPTGLVKLTISGQQVQIQTPPEKWEKIVNRTELEALAMTLAKAHNNMAGKLAPSGEKLDFEFKWIDENRQLLIKQVRPLRETVQYFNGFGPDQSLSGKDLSNFLNVSYNSCTSAYVDYVEENAYVPGQIEPYTPHLKMEIKKNIPEVTLAQGEVFEFLDSGDFSGTTIGHPFMHHGPYDLSVSVVGNSKVQSFQVPSLGTKLSINGQSFPSPVACEPKVVYTNWPLTLEDQMK